MFGCGSNSDTGGVSGSGTASRSGNAGSPSGRRLDRLAAIGQNAVLVSADTGKSWQKVTRDSPYNDASGVCCSKYQKAFFIN